MSSKNKTFILLCAGHKNPLNGSRSLFRVNSDYLIYTQLRAIRDKYKTAEIICVLGFQAEKIYSIINQFKIRVVYNDLYQSSSSMKSLLYGIRNTYDDTYIIHGDTYFTSDTIFDSDENTILVNHNPSKSIGVGLNNGVVTQLSYGFDNTWQKIIHFNQKTVKQLRQIPIIEQDEKRLDFELYNRLIDKGLIIKPIQGKTYEVINKDTKCVL